MQVYITCDSRGRYLAAYQSVQAYLDAHTEFYEEEPAARDTDAEALRYVTANPGTRDQLVGGDYVEFVTVTEDAPAERLTTTVTVRVATNETRVYTLDGEHTNASAIELIEDSGDLDFDSDIHNEDIDVVHLEVDR